MPVRSDDQCRNLLIAYDHPQPVARTTTPCEAAHPIGAYVVLDVIWGGNGSQHIFQKDTHLLMRA